MADGGKKIPESIFADDNGEADARLAQALIRHGAGKGSFAEVVDALAYARVLVPILADGEERHIGKHGIEQDHIATTGVVAVEMPDGRAALPIFTDVAAMAAWNPDARPIPAEGPRAALAAISEDWSVLILNPGKETLPIPRPAVWALAQGNPWQPAVLDGDVAADVRAGIVAAIETDDALIAVDAVAGGGAEITVVAQIVPGLSAPELSALVERIQEQIASATVVAERVDSIQLKLAQADA